MRRDEGQSHRSRVGGTGCGGSLRVRMSLAWIAALAVLACSTNPVTGQREIVLMSTDREEAIGEQAAQQIAAQMGLVSDETLTSYVRSIGARLAALSPRQDIGYVFHVVDLPEPNAFALPGGHIYVSRGLLALANSEDELANVIGHEIGHAAARHQAQREVRGTAVGVLTTLGTIAAAVAGSGEAAQAMGQLGQLAGAGLLASYSRDQEREADRVGQSLAARAGWDPSAMSAFLSSLGRDAELRSGQKRRPGFLDSHPGTEERAQTARGLARSLDPAPAARIAGSQAEFLARIQGLRLGEDPAAGIFRDETFMHPDLDLHIEFPNGWAMRNEPTAVGAISREGRAFIKMEFDSEGEDVAAAAQRFLEQADLRARPSRTKVGDRVGYRAEVQDRGRAVEFTWIPHRGQIYRIMAVCDSGTYRAYRRLFDNTLESFRRLTPEERSSIVDRRLEIVTGRAGETLEQLGQRTGNVWTIEETAVANGLFAYDALAEDRFIKIATEREYQPRSRAERGDSGAGVPGGFSDVARDGEDG